MSSFKDSNKGQKGNNQHGSHGSSDSAHGHNSHSASVWNAEEFKTMIKNHGKAKVGGKEWELKSPASTDASLQLIIKDPNFTAKTVEAHSDHNKVTFELWGNGKTAKVVIAQRNS